LRLPQNRADYEKVVVTNTITELDSMMLRSASANSLTTGDKAITFYSASLRLPTRIKYEGIGAAFGNWGNITFYQLKSDPLTIAQDLSVLPGALGITDRITSSSGRRYGSVIERQLL